MTNSLQKSELHVFKKTVRYTNFYCPFCQAHEAGQPSKKGMFLWYHDSKTARCMNTRCMEWAFLTTGINYSLTNNNMTLSTLPQLNKELIEKYQKGAGWETEAKVSGRRMLNLSIDMPEGYAEEIEEMHATAEESTDKYEDLYVNFEKLEKANARALFFDVPEDESKRPPLKVFSDQIAVWNRGEPLLVKEAIDKIEGNDEDDTRILQNNERYASSVGAFWKIGEDNNNEYYGGNINIKKVLKSGKGSVAPRKFVIVAKKDFDPEDSKPSVTVLQYNRQLFDTETQASEGVSTEAVKNKELSKPKIETSNQKEVSETPVGGEDDITPSSLPF